MYRKLAICITDKFISKKLIADKKKDIYAYGFEMLISILVYFVEFLIISLLTQTLASSLCFLGSLFIVRKVAGGHHANNYISCNLLSTANHILFVILVKLVNVDTYYTFITLTLLFSAATILLIAPVDHKNKPFIKNEYKRYKLLSSLYCIVLGIVVLLVSGKMIPASELLLGFTFGTLSATLSLLCAKIIRSYERRKKHEEV